MRKIICIVLICLLLLSGGLYTFIYSRGYSVSKLENQISRRNENVYFMLARERDGPSLFENIGGGGNEIGMNRINQDSAVARAWFSHIKERVNQYGK